MKLDLRNMSIVEFANFIRKRYGLFFGKKPGLTDLSTLLLGYSLNCRTESVPPFSEFDRWTRMKLKKFGSNMISTKVILEVCDFDEEKAFEKFYELLDEFSLIKPLNIYTSKLSDDHFSFFHNKKEKPKSWLLIGSDPLNRVLEPAPYIIKVIVFDYGVHSYYYDYYYAVGDNGKVHYSNFHETLDESFAWHSKKFGALEWAETSAEQLLSEYELLIKMSRNI